MGDRHIIAGRKSAAKPKRQLFRLWCRNYMNVLFDWLGSGGKPVNRLLAEHRSESCLTGNDGKECPHHRAPQWWENAKSAIADAILDQLSEKHKLDLYLKNEEKLKMCALCGCCMRLKPWVPIEHVKSYMTPKEILKYPSYCWIRKEISS